MALEQYGYVTTADCRALDIAPVEMRKLASRGTLQHISHGLYRFEIMPPSKFDSFMEAVLRVGKEAWLARESVLALHELAEANPRALTVYTPHRVRRAEDPRFVVVRERLPDEDKTAYFGIPSTTLHRAIRDSAGLISRNRIRAAASKAREEGLLTGSEMRSLIADGIVDV